MSKDWTAAAAQRWSWQQLQDRYWQVRLHMDMSAANPLADLPAIWLKRYYIVRTEWERRTPHQMRVEELLGGE